MRREEKESPDTMVGSASALFSTTLMTCLVLLLRSLMVWMDEEEEIWWANVVKI